LSLYLVEWQRHKQVLTQDSFNYFEVLVRIISLIESLLPSKLSVVGKLAELASRENPTRIENFSLLFFRTLFEESSSKHVFLALKRVVVLNIVVVRLIKHAVGVVVTVWILVSDSSGLENRVA
jgi:hypothetical protein